MRFREWLQTLFIVLVTAVASATASGAVVAAPHQVVVYYANETAARVAGSANYASLLAALKQSAKPSAAALAAALVQDATEYPAAVHTDVNALIGAARRGRFDLAVFTNTLALEAQYLFYRHAADAVETRRWPVLPDAPSTILALSPLARADYLRAALLEVVALYPPSAAIETILITNSHGAEDLALTPRVFADLSIANATDLVAQLDAPLLASGERPAWVVHQGTTKRDYWRTIAEVSAVHDHLRFALVFRESCRSGVMSWAEYAAVPASVGLIAHSSDRDIRYGDFDYAEIFAAAERGPNLPAAVAAQLQRRGIDVDARATMWIGLARDSVVALPLTVFFVPLAVWLIWYALSGLGARRREGSRSPRLEPLDRRRCDLRSSRCIALPPPAERARSHPCPRSRGGWEGVTP